LEEYLELDRQSEARLEYWDGEVFDMSGVSPQHAAIEVNLIFHLRTKLAGRGCHVFPANLRLRVPTLPPYRYGDVSALCGQPRFEMIIGIEALTNPSLIIEVLSPSTEAQDRGDKFTHYKSIPNLTEYLLIAQHRPHVSQFIRQADGSWNQREFNDLSEAVTLTTLACTLQLSEIYENVVFVPQPRALNPVVPETTTPGSL
jgi:Uma2 family endonuclease